MQDAAAASPQRHPTACSHCVDRFIGTTIQPKARVGAVGLLERWAATDLSLLAPPEQGGEGRCLGHRAEQAASAAARARAASPGPHGVTPCWPGSTQRRRWVSSCAYDGSSAASLVRSSYRLRMLSESDASIEPLAELIRRRRREVRQ